MDERPWADLTKLSLTWLVTFMTVLESDSQADAARKLSISEGTVSRQMKDLRLWVGRSTEALLFDTDAPSGLTSKGQEVVDLVKTMTELFDGVRTPFQIGKSPKKKVDISAIKVPGR